jgi:hypothetical protein
VDLAPPLPPKILPIVIIPSRVGSVETLLIAPKASLSALPSKSVPIVKVAVIMPATVDSMYICSWYRSIFKNYMAL